MTVQWKAPPPGIPGGQTPSSMQKYPNQSRAMIVRSIIPRRITGNMHNRITVLRLFRQIWVWIPTYFIEM
jgi:hypothetical protein